MYNIQPLAVANITHSSTLNAAALSVATLRIESPAVAETKIQELTPLRNVWINFRMQASTYLVFGRICL